MSQFKQRWVVIFALLLLVGCAAVYFMVDVPAEASLASGDKKVKCRDYASPTIIDTGVPLNVAVWNIYKQQLDGWDTELSTLSKRNALILLQEAQSKPRLSQYIEREGWHSNQAYAFAVNGEIAGVMTLSDAIPKRVCAYTKVEPYLRLPKSALYSQFALSNGESLSVVNIHSINFTFGTDEYRAQLRALVQAASGLDGPLIVAGDLNTWSDERLELVSEELHHLGLAEVEFRRDERLKVFGHALDHLFYRGVELKASSSQSTSASDHAFIEASFVFMLHDERDSL
ncbi:endonuclease/exonuclease/phosphatase family protein [Enterovibrio calviensis]|uniref:endonuclease/exonuclease/phosphatase family protein n=1 Tax=Enterovibrio calviensis TaxID=91359 RepID=UPI0004813A03|nr:endonuclease/exonuclease/phosphatase family protein [Enterovibrio calviensis]